MATSVKVIPAGVQSKHPWAIETRGPSVVQRQRHKCWGISGLQRIVLLWTIVVFGPWALQLRSFVLFRSPHVVPADLVVKSSISLHKDSIQSKCPASGLYIGGVWWNIDPVAYTSHGGVQGDHSLCRFVTQQYNIHGAFVIDQSRKVPTKECGSLISHAPALHVYWYHGTIGYYSFFASGSGVFCDSISTGYVVIDQLGTADLNGQKLVHDLGGFNGGNEVQTRWSIWYTTVGGSWIVYRVAVLYRSLLQCIDFAKRAENAHESIDIQSAFVFIQECARLVPHSARNFHRVLVIYALVEGLMIDLFLMLLASSPLSAVIQYASIGYNLAGLLTAFFEIIQTSSRLSDHTYTVIHRIFFNNEMAFVGELTGALVTQYHIETLNRSPFRQSLVPAQAVSYYVWSLVGHGAVLLGLIGIILGVRIIGALVIVQIKFRDLRVFLAPNCVEEVLRSRLKVALLTGYVWRNDRLYYSRKALTSLGILQTDPEAERGRRGEDELLLHYEVKWWGRRSSLVVVGRLGECNSVYPCTETMPSHSEPVFCDRLLGGPATNRNIDV